MRNVRMVRSAWLLAAGMLPALVAGCGSLFSANTVGSLVQAAVEHKTGKGSSSGSDAIISPVTGKPCPFLTKSGTTPLGSSVLGALAGGRSSSSSPQSASGTSPEQLLSALGTKPAQAASTRGQQDAVLEQIQVELAACPAADRTKQQILQRVQKLPPAQRLEFLTLLRKKRTQAAATSTGQDTVLQQIQAELAAYPADDRTKQQILQHVQQLTPAQRLEFLTLLRQKRTQAAATSTRQDPVVQQIQAELAARKMDDLTRQQILQRVQTQLNPAQRVEFLRVLQAQRQR